MNSNQILNRIVQLEQIAQPASKQNRYICYVDAGADRDEVLAQFKIDNDVTDTDIIHVVKFVTPETVSRQ